MHAVGVGAEKRRTWAAYVRRIAGDVTGSAIAARTGVDAGSVHRWFRLEVDVTAPAAISFARGYGVAPVEALIAARILTPHDLTLAAPMSLPTAALVNELVRRLPPGANVPADALAETPGDDHTAPSARVREIAS